MFHGNRFANQCICFALATPIIIGVCCICCFHSYISHDACFCQSPENKLKGYILLQIENNKTLLLSSLSRGYQADRVPGCHVTCWPISAEFERCNEPRGNKGSLITTPKPSCRPQPAPRISHWQPSHSWGHRRKILQPTQPSLFSTICEWTVGDVKTGGTVFLISQALFAFITALWQIIYLSEQEAYWGCYRHKEG